MSTLWARLQPHNPKQGFCVMRYGYRGETYIGGDRPNWYRIDDALADELRSLVQNESDPRSPNLFQVVTAEEKDRINAAEQQQYLIRIGALSQTVVNAPQDYPAPREIDRAEAPTGGRAAALPPPRAAEESKTASYGPQDVLPLPMPVLPEGAVTSEEIQSTRRRTASKRVVVEG
jgi:hypothetical protein